MKCRRPIFGRSVKVYDSICERETNVAFDSLFSFASNEEDFLMEKCMLIVLHRLEVGPEFLF